MTFSSPSVRRVAVGGAVVVAAVAVYLFVVFSGTVNVAAVGPKQGALDRFIDWTLDTTKDNSVFHHGEAIKAPDLSDSTMVKVGFDHFNEMCVSCHGAPGVPPEELAKGLNPHPPGLLDAAQHWTPGALFWIIKYGVKMTGMPAWGPTHSDQKIWDIVAFMKKLPSISPAQYHAMVLAAKAHGEGDDQD